MTPEDDAKLEAEANKVLNEKHPNAKTGTRYAYAGYVWIKRNRPRPGQGVVARWVRE